MDCRICGSQYSAGILSLDLDDAGDVVAYSFNDYAGEVPGVEYYGRRLEFVISPERDSATVLADGVAVFKAPVSLTAR